MLLAPSFCWDPTGVQGLVAWLHRCGELWGMIVVEIEHGSDGVFLCRIAAAAAADNPLISCV